MVDKEGWINRHEYLKFAVTTELLKVEFQDRVFQKVDLDDKKEGGGPSKKDSKKVSKKSISRIRSSPMEPSSICQGIKKAV